MVHEVKLLALSVFISLLILSKYSISDSFAMSPSFSRQEIIQPKNTHWKVDPTSHCPPNWSKYANSSDLAVISYYSDGKTLNANLILSSPFKRVPFHNISYYMIVQPPSLYETPNNQRGTYVDGIFSNESGKWYTWVYEQFSNYLNRTIYKSDKDNYTGFFDKRDNSISLSLDLATISSPNEYLLSFWAEDDSKIRDKVCSKLDSTPWFPIPQPKVSISAIPSSIDLRPGEKKHVHLEVRAPIPELRWNFSSRVILIPQPVKDLQVSPKNYKNNFTIYVPSHGLNTTAITIAAPGNPNPNETLPDTHPLTIKSILTIANYSLLGPDIARDRLYSPSFTNNITRSFSNLTVTLLPDLSFAEKFSAFWSTYGPAISLVGGGFVFAGAALFFNRVFRHKAS